jgi:hypothetical protein
MAQFPQLNDSQNNLLAKIAANTGESQPRVGDGQHNLLFKIAQNTYASAVTGSSALQSSGDNYVLVQPGDDLASKYAEAKAKSPSASNRITVFIIPGTYSLSSELAIDAEYVDLVGLGAQFQSPAVIVSNNTLNVTANNVRVSGISVGLQEFKIADNKPLQVFENCTGGDFSFGGGGTASGTFVGCVGGDNSFAGYDITQSSTSTFNGCIAGQNGFGGNLDEYPSGKYISCKVTLGTFPTIYIPGRARFCLDEDYNIVNADGGYDSDVESFITAAGVTSATAKDQLNLFVIGVKRLGLWDDMVCWPLRSAQNAGTGSTAYSLGGLGAYNGTLVNGPTWGADGITFDGTDDRISTALSINGTAGLFSAFTVFKRTAQGNEVRSLLGHRAALTGVRLLFENQIWLYSDYAGALGQSFTNIAGVANDTWATAAMSLNKPAFTGNLWQNTTNATLASTSNNATGSGDFGIGAQGAAFTFDLWKGDIAFAAALVGQSLTSSQNTAFRDLYKSTLGQGLGLP